MPTERTRLEEIKKRCERGNPYPVRVVGRNVRTSVENFVVISPDDFAATAYVANPDDAELYAHCNGDIPYLLSLVEKQAQTIAIFLDIISFREKFRSAKNDIWHLECMMDELYHAAKMTPEEAADYVKHHIVNFQMAQTIQEIKSLCQNSREKDGCQSVTARVYRLCEEAEETLPQPPEREK